MLQEIQKFSDSDVYSVVLPDEPEKMRYWFRASEISKFLAYSDTFRAVHSHCKDWQYREFQVGKGRPALYVCESGVYRLILRSKAPIASEFQDWLTEEVLPKLRASGGYIMPTATSDQLQALVQKHEETIADLKQKSIRYLIQKSSASSFCFEFGDSQLIENELNNRAQKEFNFWLNRSDRQDSLKQELRVFRSNFLNQLSCFDFNNLKPEYKRELKNKIFSCAIQWHKENNQSFVPNKK
jgi:prophage antirepressor-like protein